MIKVICVGKIKEEYLSLMINDYYKRINNTEEEGFNLADICFSLGDIYCGLKEGECRNCMIPIAI